MYMHKGQIDRKGKDREREGAQTRREGERERERYGKM